MVQNLQNENYAKNICSISICEKKKSTRTESIIYNRNFVFKRNLLSKQCLHKILKYISCIFLKRTCYFTKLKQIILDFEFLLNSLKVIDNLQKKIFEIMLFLPVFCNYCLIKWRIISIKTTKFNPYIWYFLINLKTTGKIQ